MRKRFLFMLVLALFGTDGKADPAKLVFEEMPLEVLGNPPAEAWNVQLNQAGTLAAWICKGYNTQTVAINGKEGPPFDWVDYPAITTDQKHVFYLANRGGTPSESRRMPEPTGGQWYQVIDNQEGPKYAAGDHVPDRPKLAFESRIGDLYHAISLDGKHVANVVHEDDRWQVVVDGKAGPIYSWAILPVFSRDAQRLAYIAGHPNPDKESNDREFVVVDGREGQGYYGISRSGICFSPDGRHVAYLARYRGSTENSRFVDLNIVVLDDKELEGKNDSGLNIFCGGFDLAFSADSQWLAYSKFETPDPCVVVRRVDGSVQAESHKYRQVWLQNDQPAGVIHFFGLRDQTFYRVEAKLSE